MVNKEFRCSETYIEFMDDPTSDKGKDSSNIKLFLYLSLRNKSQIPI